ncbi:hypothetical protein CDL15_Pgr024125 [Punica granatum]|uniref:Uncharacterized protein n=1 Tax=Punica granatum TaxID=22663 RepID=A0A218XWD1_PUNGR|nr:hypothetical protein CDL15_Pgr024125 [Punica granatum]
MYKKSPLHSKYFSTKRGYYVVCRLSLDFDIRSYLLFGNGVGYIMFKYAFENTSNRLHRVLPTVSVSHFPSGEIPLSISPT